MEKNFSKKNVIFLDFDGVLNDNPLSSKEQIFFPKAVLILKYIILKYSAMVIVISSSQGDGRSEYRNKIVSLLNNLGITDIDFINPMLFCSLGDITFPTRIAGISNYLIEHPSCSYIIFDDDYKHYYKLLNLNIHKPIFKIGLTKRDLSYIYFMPNTHRGIKRLKFESLEKHYC